MNAVFQFQRQSQSNRKNSRKQSSTWSKDETKQLIEAVETFECLWNFDVKDYKNKHNRDAAWLKVASSIVGRDKTDCTAKWNALRTNYRVGFENNQTFTFFYFECTFKCIHLQGTLAKLRQTKSGQEAIRNNVLTEPYQLMKFLYVPVNLEPKFRVSSAVSSFHRNRPI